MTSIGATPHSLTTVLAHSVDVLSQVRDGVDSGFTNLENGVAIPLHELLPHQVIAMSLNCEGGIVCAPLELLKRERPREIDSLLFEKLRQGVDWFRQVAYWCLDKLKMANPRRILRRFDYKYHRVFSVEWYIEKLNCGRQNASERLERLLDAVASGVRRFLAWLIEIMRRVETLMISTDERPLTLGEYARSFVLAADRSRGVIVLDDEQSGVKTFKISPRAVKAWHWLRLLLSSRECDGAAALPQNYSTVFRNTDANNELVRNGLYEIGLYIQPLGSGRYHLTRTRRAGYQK